MAMPPIAGDINLLMEGGKEHVSDTGVDDGVVRLVLLGRIIWLRELGIDLCW